MDSPDRSRAGGAAISGFEDSPVFNFINSLSPIQPVKSIYLAYNAQAYQSLNFASSSSIFTSPHANLQKESRISNRNPFGECSEQDICSDAGAESRSCISRLSTCTTTARDTHGITCSLNEAAVAPPEDSSIDASILHPALQFDVCSPNHSTIPRHGMKTDLKQHIRHKEDEPACLDQNGSDKNENYFMDEMEIQQNVHLDNDKDEVLGCDWENLIADNVDELLILDEAGVHRRVGVTEVDNDADSCKTLLSELVLDVDDSKRVQHNASSDPCAENMIEKPLAESDGLTGMEDETDHTPQLFPSGQSKTMSNEQVIEKFGEFDDYLVNKVDPQQQRGTRRRCLVFEASGFPRRNVHESKANSFVPSKSKMNSDNHVKPGRMSSPHVLPGIGLHLNALAAKSKDRMVILDSSASEKQPTSIPCNIASFSESTSGHKIQIKSLSISKDLVPYDSELQGSQIFNDDTLFESVPGNAEESSQSSPKKKRRKFENNGEGEACKRCSCKKSKCLKLYCECFAGGVYCSEPCACQGCFNKPIHEEIVLSTRKQIEFRNPLAFAPKVIQASDPSQEAGDDSNNTPASARHKRGCNCKKSSCLKKYCECYQGGVGCSASCRCEGCKNTFGRRDCGIQTGGEETEQGGEETHTSEDERPDNGQQTAVAQNNEHHFSENTPITTPIEPYRTLVQPLHLSSAKPPRPSILTGCSSRLCTSEGLLKPEMLHPLYKFNAAAAAAGGFNDDMPDVLRGGVASSNCAKTSSPNGKRVSPPHTGIGLSPSRKGCRKLILKSIPSFPSLNEDVHNECTMNTANSSFGSSLLSRGNP